MVRYVCQRINVVFSCLRYSQYAVVPASLTLTVPGMMLPRLPCPMSCPALSPPARKW